MKHIQTWANARPAVGLLVIVLNSFIFVTNGSKCNESLNQFDVYWDGGCHTGTSYDDELECCVGCPHCGPGWYQSPECKGPCLPCPNRFYSDELRNIICYPCTVCEKLHRPQIYDCLPIMDTKCGDCLPGYFSYPVHRPFTSISCLPCYHGNTEASCIKYFGRLNTTTKINNTGIWRVKSDDLSTSSFPVAKKALEVITNQLQASRANRISNGNKVPLSTSVTLILTCWIISNRI